MTDTMAQGAERRVHERLGVVVPVELRLFDRHGGACVVGPMHALVTDASVSGLRVELAGPSAKIFEDSKYLAMPVAVSFLLVAMAEVGQVSCDIRWNSPTPEGRALGLQVAGEKLMQRRVLHMLESTSMPRMARRTAMKAAGFGAAALLVAGLVAFSADGMRVQSSLREQIDMMTGQMNEMQKHADDLQRRLELANRDNARMQQRLEILEPDDQEPAPEEAEAPPEEGHAEDAPTR